MPLSRSVLSALTLTTAVVVMGCADQAPTGAPALQVAPAGAVTTSFVVSPTSPTTAVIGDHKIKFDASAICDPALSTYGSTEWDKPCTVATAGVKITATYWTDASGFPQIDFQPSLRFNPASNVTLFMMDKQASADPSYKILWVNALGQAVDEAATDPSATTVLGTNGFKYRRIKHFSGYLISTSRSSSTED